MLLKSQTWSFQVLADLRVTNIGSSLPSPTEILDGKILVTKEARVIDFNAFRTILQMKQMKQSLPHDNSHQTEKQRPLVMG